MASSSSSFSFSKSHWIYDVFINFRGEDTRKNFVSHLNSALCNAGVKTFFDDSSLRKGHELKRELPMAIEGSQIAIVIFSKRYAESKWCLEELDKIMKCKADKDQKVFPVFYDVSPSIIRLAMGKSDIQNEIEELIAVPIYEPSRKAMAEACDLAGWDVKNYRNENDVVKEIVQAVVKELDRTYMLLPEYAVGLDFRAKQVSDFIQQQRQQRERVCVVGIWGMGGIGKTTVAKAVYNEIRREFEDKSFLSNIRETWETDKGKTNLQGQLLSDVTKTKEKVPSIDWGKQMIKEKLCEKRALIVLDDVNKLEQLNALCGHPSRIGPGNVIIITSRDKRLLEEFEVDNDNVFGVDELNESEALELFNWHAFKEKTSKRDFIELSRNVVSYCGGLPLALEVLGSHLHKRKKEEWESALSKLEKIPNKDIQEKLKISYDGLSDDMVQGTFLDMCCFFIGKDRAYVTKILNGCGLHADIGIPVLVERTLIKFDKNNKLVMHNLLRDMGREIVRQSSPDKPENRSRLWAYEEVIEVLNEHTGTIAIEGLALKSQRVCTKAFENMKRLRLLQLEDVKLYGDYKYLSQHLRWIYWKGFPLRHIPDNFAQGKVVVIDLKHSNLKQVWKETPLLDKLRILNLSHSRYLTETPNFKRLPNLERLILKNCSRLSEVHHSIGNLSSLVLINLKDCASLRNLPIETYKLKSVQTLILSGCTKIDKLEEDIVQMKSLTTLIADRTGINRVPFSVVSSNIGRISLCGYEGLARDVFPSLIWSWMSPTKGIVSYNQPLEVMSTSPISIDIQGNKLGDLLSVHGGLSKLRCIGVECDSEIQLSQVLRTVRDHLIFENFTESITTSSYTSQVSRTSWGSRLIGIGNYNQVLDMLSNNLSKGLTTNDSSDIFLPDDNYPYWLAYKGEGHSVHFQVPEDSDCRMKGVIFCVVYSSTPETMAVEYFPSVLIINNTKCTLEMYRQDTVMSFNDQDWQGIQSNLEPGDNVEILVAFDHGLIVKKTGVYLIYDSSITNVIEESIGIAMEPSPYVNVHPSSHVKKEPSQKRNKNIFTRLAKKMGGWSGLN